MSSEAAFVTEHIKRATAKGSLRYPADYVAKEQCVIKRKTVLPVPISCLFSIGAETTAADGKSDQSKNNQQPTSASQHLQTTLTIKTLAGQAYKLHVNLAEIKCKAFHDLVRSECGVKESSNVRILRQGRVIPDSDADLRVYVTDGQVPLNLIEQQSNAQPVGMAGEAFLKDIDHVIMKHVPDAQKREKLRKGISELYSQL